jgi:RNA polymerase sigma factor (TIGR02999 family)
MRDPGTIDALASGSDTAHIAAIPLYRASIPLRHFHDATMATPETEVDRLFSMAYEELRRMAAHVRRGDPSQTLNPTALVNEAYLKLARSPGLRVESPLHFKRIAARAMRQVLVEAARRRDTAKRGSGVAHVTLDPRLDGEIEASAEVIALDEALDDLEQAAPRQARVVELRFFGGLDVAETAEALAVSEATVSRDWRAARAWLSGELRSER